MSSPNKEEEKAEIEVLGEETLMEVGGPPKNDGPQKVPDAQQKEPAKLERDQAQQRQEGESEYDIRTIGDSLKPGFHEVRGVPQDGKVRIRTTTRDGTTPGAHPVQRGAPLGKMRRVVSDGTTPGAHPVQRGAPLGKMRRVVSDGTTPGAHPVQRGAPSGKMRRVVSSPNNTANDMDSSTPGAHGLRTGPQHGNISVVNNPGTAGNNVGHDASEKSSRPGIQEIRRGSQLGKGDSQRTTSTGSAASSVGGTRGRMGRRGSKPGNGGRITSIGSLTVTSVGAISMSGSDHRKLGKGGSATSVVSNTSMGDISMSGSRHSQRSSKLGKGHSRHSFRDANDVTETEDMTDTSDIGGLPGQLNLNQNTHNNSESSRPGAYGAVPGRGPQRADTLRFSLVGMTTEQEIDVFAGENSSNFITDGGSTAPPPSITSQGTSSLAVATEVEENSTPLELPRASSVHSMDGEGSAARNDEEEQRKMEVYAAFGVLLLVIIIGIVAIAIVLGVVLRSSSEDTPGKTQSTPFMETLVNKPSVRRLFDSLPIKTKESILEGGTPQAKSWEWLVGHKDIMKLPEFRKQQLFALSTFFYAFEGPLWPQRISQNWLDDTMNECLWITTSIEYLTDITETFMQNKNYDLNPCTEAGHIQTLALRFLGLAGANPFMPPEISLLPSLTFIALPFNQIDVPLSNLMPSELQQLPHLEVFIIPYNKIQGTIPEDISLFTDLHHLVLGQSQISGTIPSEIALLSQLRQLTIHDVPIGGKLPTELGLLTKLTDIEIFNCPTLSGAIPTQLGLLSKLNELAFPDNGLSGTIPSQLGLFTNMRRHFLLAGNNLFGTLPSELGQLTLMTNMDLASNQLLEGTIPSEFGLMVAAKMLKLGTNKLSGFLPSQLGLLPLMEHLSLEGNELSGNIPSQILGLPLLKQVDLTNLPLLSGTISEDLCLLNTNTSCSVDLNMITTRKCYVSFDCTESMCGCDCLCATKNSTL